MPTKKKSNLITIVQDEVYEASLQSNGDFKGINHFFPLLRINQQVGELAERIIDNSEETILQNIVGRICIDVLDCTARYGIKASFIWPIKPKCIYSNPTYLLVAVGQLNKAFLEAHTDKSRARIESGKIVCKAFMDLLLHIAYYSDVRDFPFNYWNKNKDNAFPKEIDDWD